MRPPKKAEPLPRPPPVPGKDVSALLYLIAAYPAGVQTALAKSDAIDGAAAAGAVAMAVERTGAQKAKRGRSLDISETEVGDPHVSAAGGDDTPTPGRLTQQVEQRLNMLESKVEKLYVHYRSEFCHGSKRHRTQPASEADLAYWMPLAPGLCPDQFGPGEVVAIVEAKATQTQEVRKLTVAVRDSEWFPAVISDVFWHAANEQPSGQPAVTVCMLGFVPVTVANDAVVSVNDEICVFIDDHGVTIRPLRSGDLHSDGVFTVGRALEGGHAAGENGPRCFVRWQAETLRSDSHKLKLLEEHVQRELAQLTLRVFRHEVRLSALEAEVKGEQTPRCPITTRKNFIGRRTELNALRNATLKSPGQAIVMIWGRGGLGKTTLMHACHEELKANYDLVINVDGRGDVKAVKVNVVSHARDLKAKMKSEIPVDEQVQTIKERIAGKRCLILVDNIDDVDTTTFWSSFLSDPSEPVRALPGRLSALSVP
jgi:hypothetical protein